MRLIDADALLQRWNDIVPRMVRDKDGGIPIDFLVVIHELDTTPTLTLDDLMPKGRWVEYENEADMGYHYCSECKHQAFNCDEGDCNVEILSDYCPNCGAKMDGGDKNDE